MPYPHTIPVPEPRVITFAGLPATPQWHLARREEPGHDDPLFWAAGYYDLPLCFGQGGEGPGQDALAWA